MSSYIFKTLLQRQIDNFIDTYGQDSNSLFKDKEGRLIHPGEYGMYREECFKRLLQVILDKDYAVSDGFVINSDDKVSTQCDVLVHKYNSKPLIDGSYAKFFPVEDIVAICEIKSNLNKSNFKDALRKLASNKMLGDSRKIVKHRPEVEVGNYYPIPSFLICNKLNFNLNEINFLDIYEGIPKAYWHNCILSLEDAVITYELAFSKLGLKSREFNALRGYNVDTGVCEWQYSQHIMFFDGRSEIYDCLPHIITVNENDVYSHIYLFLGSLEQSIKNCIKYDYDFGDYLGITSSTIRQKETW